MVTGGFTGEVTGEVTGGVTGEVTGVFTGEFTGEFTGGVTGGFTGKVTGVFTGGFTGEFTGGVTGGFTGVVTGEGGIQVIYTGDYIRPKLAQETKGTMLAQMDSMIYYDTVSEFFLGIPISSAFEDAIAEARILRTLKEEVNYV